MLRRWITIKPIEKKQNYWKSNFDIVKYILCFVICTNSLSISRNYQSWNCLKQFLSFCKQIVYRKIPVIVPPSFISPSNLKQIVHPGYKPPLPDISPYIFIIIFFILFITRWDFSSSDKKREKVKKTKVCNIFTFLITLMLF